MAGKRLPPVADEGRRKAYGIVHPLQVGMRMAEPPGPHPLVDDAPLRAARLDASRSEYPAVIVAAGLWPVGIDRAPPGSEHRAVAIGPMAHHGMAGRLVRRIDQHLCRNPGACTPVPGPQRDEVGGYAAADTAATGNLHRGATAQGGDGRLEPRAELTRFDLLVHGPQHRAAGAALPSPCTALEQGVTYSPADRGTGTSAIQRRSPP